MKRLLGLNLNSVVFLNKDRFEKYPNSIQSSLPFSLKQAIKRLLKMKSPGV
jgi:hypothetical protein